MSIGHSWVCVAAGNIWDEFILEFGKQGSIFAFSSCYETGDMLQLVRAVLYVPPTQTAAESAFSIQKWMLSGRRATMTPANCNLRMACMRLKRRINEVKM